MNKQANDEIIKARSLLLLDQPFWGVLAMRMKFIEEPLCPTAATNGDVILYNPDYILSLTVPERIGLIAHEVSHPALGDIWRLDSRDPDLWNVAADYVNNLILTDPKVKFTLPKGALIDPTFANKCKEEVYAILKQRQQSGENKGQGKAQGKKQGTEKYPDYGGCGSMFSPENPEESKQSENEWKAAIVQAAQMARGDLPASLQRIIQDEIIDPPLPWHVLLRDFVQRTARNDYNWTRPNRKYLSQEIILPGLISDELPTVVVAVDTSGSISDEQLQRFSSEASTILGSYKTHIHLFQCDAAVQKHTEYDTEDLPIHIDYKGGGGTDFRPVFKRVEDEGITPACLIYLTDLDGRFPDEEPLYPVMWISSCRNQKLKAPFGETIQLQVIN